MSNIISLAKHREENTPHWGGPCKCTGCGHEWVGVGPIGVVVGLDCPNCELPKGTTKHPFSGAEGDMIFQCNCGCEALTAFKRKGHFHIICMGCGTHQTEAIYG